MLKDQKPDSLFFKTVLERNIQVTRLIDMSPHHQEHCRLSSVHVLLWTHTGPNINLQLNKYINSLWILVGVMFTENLQLLMTLGQCWALSSNETTNLWPAFEALHIQQEWIGGIGLRGWVTPATDYILLNVWRWSEWWWQVPDKLICIFSSFKKKNENVSYIICDSQMFVCVSDKHDTTCPPAHISFSLPPPRICCITNSSDRRQLNKLRVRREFRTDINVNWICNCDSFISQTAVGWLQGWTVDCKRCHLVSTPSFGTRIWDAANHQ